MSFASPLWLLALLASLSWMATQSSSLPVESKDIPRIRSRETNGRIVASAR